MKHHWTRSEAWAKATAALLGGFLLFLAFALATAAGLPALGLPVADALAVSTSLSVPVWMVASIGSLLAPSGRAAWALMAGPSVVLFAIVLGVTTWPT